MSRIIIVLLILNAVSCFIFRVFIHRGKMRILDFNPEKEIPPKEASILIAGLMNQPYQAFKELKSVNVERVIYAEYSCLGWNSKTSAKQLDAIKYDPSTRVNVYAISVGDKVARHMLTCTHIYSIDPCPHPYVLREEISGDLAIIAVVFEILSFFLGWLAVLPVISCGESRFSLALIADQLWEISIVRSTPPNNRGITSIVSSNRDEFIDRLKLWRFYKHKTMPEIITSSKHARTMDLAWSKEYDEAILKLKERR